jgi:hypothetical protein
MRETGFLGVKVAMGIFLRVGSARTVAELAEAAVSRFKTDFNVGGGGPGNTPCRVPLCGPPVRRRR